MQLEVAEGLAEERVNDQVKDPLIGSFEARDKHGNLKHIYGLVESTQGIEIVSLFIEAKAFGSFCERSSLNSWGICFNAKELRVILSTDQ